MLVAACSGSSSGSNAQPLAVINSMGNVPTMSMVALDGSKSSDADGDSLSYSSYGADATWFTADDVVGSDDSYTYDANGNPTRDIGYSGAGPDGVWFQ